MIDYDSLSASDGSGDAALMHITGDRAIDSTTIAVDTVANVPAKFVGTSGTILASGYIDPATKCDFTGHVSGSSLIIDSFLPGSSDAGNTAGQVVVLKPNTSVQDNMVALAQVSHNDDGTMKGTAVRTALGETSTTGAGWTALGNVPDTVTANGNRSYNLVFNGVDITDTVSPGMRLRGVRTATAPIKCTSLNGSTQYYNKTSPNKLTFTDDFTVSAWVKLSSYAEGTIASRYNGTSGWRFEISATGQILLLGNNANSANVSYVQSYQSVPLNKWVHVAAQLDMSTFTATTTTSYVMINGVNVPVVVARGGTNPTALVQAGNLEIGSTNSGTVFFPGKLAQVAIYSAKVTQATILSAMNQTLVGNETSLASAYSFNNSILDLNTTTPNDLTAQGSAVATNTDTPFTQTQTGVTAGTTNYAICTAISFSTNTTMTVQVPEGDTLPITGGISAMSYATVSAPFGFPSQKSKWQLYMLLQADQTQASPSSGTWYNIGTSLTIPIGEWTTYYEAGIITQHASVSNQFLTLSTANNSESDTTATAFAQANGATALVTFLRKTVNLSVVAATPYYLNMKTSQGSTVSIAITGTSGPSLIVAQCAYL